MAAWTFESFDSSKSIFPLALGSIKGKPDLVSISSGSTNLIQSKLVIGTAGIGVGLSGSLMCFTSLNFFTFGFLAFSLSSATYFDLASFFEAPNIRVSGIFSMLSSESDSEKRTYFLLVSRAGVFALTVSFFSFVFWSSSFSVLMAKNATLIGTFFFI